MKLKSGLSDFISSAREGVSEIKVVWNEWNVQALVITSLILQLILIRVSPFRRKTSNGVVIFAAWISYLVADWIAAQAVGLISRDQNDLFAFWAQFLLLHLGGPDTITALAVEDNNLWMRTALHLGVQAYTTLGILVRSIETSRLWIPTILMFLAGVIKYMERVSALFCGRLTKFDQDPYDYADKMAIYEPKVVFVGPSAKVSEVEMVRSAFFFFHYYKGLYADRQIKFEMRLRSKRYFDWMKTPEDTFKVLEHQFNFTYEALYTKMKVINDMLWWKILRPIVLLFTVGSLVIWRFSHKRGIEGHDVLITYLLLVGALFVDVLAILRIQLSYRNIAKYSQGSSIRTWAYNKKLVLHHRTWGRYWRKEDAPIWPWLRRAFFRRWSESVFQLNLMNLVVKNKNSTMLDTLKGFTSSGTKKWFSDHLRDFIVDDLKCKSLWVVIDDRKASYICYSKGSFACVSLSTNGELAKNMHALLNVSNMEYFDVLLHWHIIVEIYYFYDEIQIPNDDDDDPHGGGGGGGGDDNDADVVDDDVVVDIGDDGDEDDDNEDEIDDDDDDYDDVVVDDDHDHDDDNVVVVVDIGDGNKDDENEDEIDDGDNDEFDFSGDDDDDVEKFMGNKTNERNTTEKDREETIDAMKEYPKICKTLSDYTMYLLLQQPVMMSAVVTGSTKQMLQDVREKIDECLPANEGESKKEWNRQAYEHLRGEIRRGKEPRAKEGEERPQNSGAPSTPPPADEPSGSRSDSPVQRKEDPGADQPAPDPPSRWTEFPYSIHPIMEGLEALEAEKGREGKWKFMAEVWAELVYYAAIRCRPSVHAAQLKQGGELLSFIWLLMVQLGFGLHGSEREANQLRDQLLPSTTSEQPKP